MLKVYLVFGEILWPLWQISDAIGQTFIVINGQISKNNPAVWSHCPPAIDPAF